jgi:predicted Zn-dependent protease with MMP-like domain
MVPSMTTRRERFDALVLEVAERARPWLGTRHQDVDFAVEDVPIDDPLAWEPHLAVLGRVIGAGATGRRIVVHRRPIEARAQSHHDLQELIREVIAEQVALILGVPPDEVTL